jgi:hypothetical protein
MNMLKLTLEVGFIYPSRCHAYDWSAALTGGTTYILVLLVMYSKQRLTFTP